MLREAEYERLVSWILLCLLFPPPLWWSTGDAFLQRLDMGKPSIKHGDQLTLTGPTLAPISCPSGYLVIEVDLFCGAFKGSTRIDWAPVPGDECKSLKTNFVSKHGEISIFLGMFFYATEALIEVSLSTKDSSDVYVGGIVAARSSKFVAQNKRQDESQSHLEC
ncbi:hypothetical protein POM88_002119 [Heracleum sosnowskyi]|uniref:DUF6598 domain-containing protein n=1 Tax=Heracleum sosnowskyi TaxID=360622 RepID=A0AAD8NAA1_9APIA|nr:hypothetical protein POM88_002119 [Heracleum sosnowskyi]